MSTQKPRSLLRIEYEESAEAYLRSLPPEHFMEATIQGRTRRAEEQARRAETAEEEVHRLRVELERMRETN
ncbi:MAG: hypothetical protein ACRELF_11480 [Gemmataceae bacterium]